MPAAASPCAAQVVAAQRGLTGRSPPRGRAVYAIANANGGSIVYLEGPWGRQYRDLVLESYRLERRGPWKGLNTAFTVQPSRAGGAPVALLAWKVFPAKGRVPRVYTPASDALLGACPGVVQSGRALLDLRVREALAALRRRSVASRVVGDQLVADVVPSNILRALFLVEKLDPGEFTRCGGGARCVHRLIDRVFLVLGANANTAWRYARSHAGAWGPMQFMPRTWEMMRTQYPAAVLQAFTHGAEDLAMSLRAAVLLVDYNLGLLDREHRAFLRAHSQAFVRYAAAAYNGNPTWAIEAIAQCGMNWTERSCGSLRSETIVYLDKVDAVWPIVTARRPGHSGGRAVPRSRLALRAGTYLRRR